MKRAEKYRKKLKGFFFGELDMEDALVKKAMESAIYGGLCLTGCLGIATASIFIAGEFLERLSSLLLVLFMVLLVVSGRYLFYVKTGRYEILSGTILGVQMRANVTGKNQSCVVFLLGDDGKRYQYQEKYRQAFHEKDMRITVYAAGVNKSLIRDGYILLDSILLQKQADKKENTYERSKAQ